MGKRTTERITAVWFSPFFLVVFVAATWFYDAEEVGKRKEGIRKDER